ncbi:MAG: hypothetical protein RL414_995 [Actinomycetota bacterium]
MNWMDPVWRDWLLTWPLLLFFFAIGQELRTELTHTTDKKHLVVPVSAALGGMLFPATIYLILAHFFGAPSMAWGVPMATDLPMVLIFLSIFPSLQQKRLRIFLITLAIADDLGSILVLGIVGSAHGGIHPTIAGALLGFLWGGRWHSLMKKIANFVVMPLFLLAAFSVHFTISMHAFTDPLVWNLIVARIVGKPLGIMVGALLGYWILKIKQNSGLRLTMKELWLCGALATLGLSVSVVFISVIFSDEAQQALAMTATVATIFIASIRLVVMRLLSNKN